jgi:hypothetical protein
LCFVKVLIFSQFVALALKASVLHTSSLHQEHQQQLKEMDLILHKLTFTLPPEAIQQIAYGTIYGSEQDGLQVEHGSEYL